MVSNYFSTIKLWPSENWEARLLMQGIWARVLSMYKVWPEGLSEEQEV